MDDASSFQYVRLSLAPRTMAALGIPVVNPADDEPIAVEASSGSTASLDRSATRRSGRNHNERHCNPGDRSSCSPALRRARKSDSAPVAAFRIVRPVPALGIDILGVQPLEMSAPVMGAPFSADTVTEFVQEFVDGNRMEQRMVGSIARDGIGRVRRELPIGVAGGPRLVTITLARRAYSVPFGQREQDRLAPADAAGAARSSRESRQGGHYPME